MDALDALRALGEAWRGDWNDFDGRTLRGQINSWIEDCQTGSRAPENWMILVGVCPVHRTWIDDGLYGYCDEECEPVRRLSEPRPSQKEEQG